MDTTHKFTVTESGLYRITVTIWMPDKSPRTFVECLVFKTLKEAEDYMESINISKMVFKEE